MGNGRASGHEYERAVGEERGIERREGATIFLTQAREVRFEPIAATTHRLAQVLDADAGREIAQRRCGGHVGAVHEHERRGSIAVPLEGREVGGLEARCAVGRRNEPAVRNRRHAREPPVLVARGRQPALAELLQALLARAGQPPRVGAAVGADALGLGDEQIG